MSRICLIRLPSPFLIEDKLFPPLGLMAVGTGLQLKGHDVFIYDGPLDSVPMDYKYYGLGPTTPEYADALLIKSRIKSINPAAKVVIGGAYATLNCQQCFDDGFDSIVIGDGELVSEGAFLKNDRVVVAPEVSLDKYPIIDRSLVDIKSYKYYLDDRLATTIMTGKGCPFSCAFCCKNHHSVRLASTENIIKEINYLYYEFGYTALAFPEDLFILNRKRAEAVFRYMKDLGINSRCLIRADVLAKYGPEFCWLMYSCGCTHVGMGIESGSDTILKNVAKGESVKTIKFAIKILKDAGIRVKGFFIVGLPGETEKTLDETRQFLDEVKLFDVDIKIFQPYPGSPIWDNKDKYDINWDEGFDYATQFYKGRPEQYYGSIRTAGLTTDAIYTNWVEMEAIYKNG